MPAVSAPRRSRLEPLMLAMLLAFVGWSYFANARTLGPLAHPQRVGYYGFLTEAFVAGQVHLKIVPDPVLLRLADPYAGPQGSSRPHDMTFYRGKFYLYYGATPALILMVPWHLLTGWHLSEYTVSTAFCYAGFVFSVCWLYGMRRRHFPELSSVWFLFFVTILAFGSPLYFSTVNATFYPVPISAAFFCLTVAGLCVDRCLRARTVGAAIIFLAGASLALGLCVGARPNYFLCLPLLFLPAFWLWKYAAARSSHRPSVPLVATAMILPAALVGSGLALYNYFRFGSPTEFGIQYSLASASVREIKLTGFEYYPKNLRLYLLHAADFIRYFPFVFTNGRPFGLWPHFTLACAALLLPLSWLSARLRRDRVWLVGSLFWFGACVANLAFLCYFFGGEYRYLVDFAPAALLVACAVSLAALHRALTWPALPRHFLRFAVVGVGAWTIFNGVLLTFADRPSTPFSTAVERGANRLVYAIEQRGGGASHGPLELKLHFPTDHIGKRQPLLTTGALVGTGDIIYVYYTDPRHVQFGYFHLGAGGPLSEPIAVDYSREHVLKIELGSLYPPREHPLFRTWTDFQVAKLRRRLALTLDGKPALQASVDVYRATPDGTQVGGNTLAGDVSAPLFTGKILSTRRLGLFPPDALSVSEAYGPVQLTLRLPPGRGGDPLPLVSTGEPGAGDLLSLQILADGRVRFTHDSWGGQNFTSPALAVGPGATHRVTVEMGSLYHPEDARVPLALRRRLAVWLDDQPVMDVERPFNPAKPETVEFGFNAIGGGGVVGMFTGTVLGVERVPSRPAPIPTTEVWGPLACEVRFPTDAIGRREPLLSTGVFGAADLVMVEYLDKRRIRFGHDHWGTDVVFTEPLEIDYAKVHTLVIQIASLYPPGGGERPLEITLDGTRTISVARVAHPSRPAQVTLGRNDVGASTCERVFSGEFTATRRLPY